MVAVVGTSIEHTVLLVAGDPVCLHPGEVTVDKGEPGFHQGNAPPPHPGAARHEHDDTPRSKHALASASLSDHFGAVLSLSLGVAADGRLLNESAVTSGMIIEVLGKGPEQSQLLI